jgi:hypothetical protein
VADAPFPDAEGADDDHLSLLDVTAGHGTQLKRAVSILLEQLKEHLCQRRRSHLIPTTTSMMISVDDEQEQRSRLSLKAKRKDLMSINPAVHTHVLSGRQDRVL